MKLPESPENSIIPEKLISSTDFLNLAVIDPEDPLGAANSYFRQNGQSVKFEITLDYLTSDKTLDQITASLNHRQTREWTRQMIENTVRVIWENSSPEIQSRFPFIQIKIGKHTEKQSLIEWPADIIQIHQKIMAEIRSGNARGVRDATHNLGILTFYNTPLNQKLADLEDYTQSSRIKHTEAETLLLNLNNPDESVAKTALQGLSRYYLQKFSATDGPLTSLTNTSEIFYINTRNAGEFADIIENLGFPVGRHTEKLDSGKEIRHYYIFKKDINRIRDEFSRRLFLVKHLKNRDRYPVTLFLKK
jgi:hypothetical protein